jgi:hypothetical protein
MDKQMDPLDRYKQELDFVLDELKQKDRTQREKDAKRKAWALGMKREVMAYVLEFTTLDELEEAIAKKANSK